MQELLDLRYHACSATVTSRRYRRETICYSSLRSEASFAASPCAMPLRRSGSRFDVMHLCGRPCRANGLVGVDYLQYAPVALSIFSSPVMGLPSFGRGLLQLLLDTLLGIETRCIVWHFSNCSPGPMAAAVALPPWEHPSACLCADAAVTHHRRSLNAEGSVLSMPCSIIQPAIYIESNLLMSSSITSAFEPP